MASPSAEGLEVLHRLKSTEPPLWLSPSTELSQAARIASQYLFSSLQPFSPKSPFEHLLVDGFDAEQIWQQIDLQSQPLLSNLRREIKRFERNPGEISKLINEEIVKEKAEVKTDAIEKENKARVGENGGQKENLEDFEDMEDEEMGISDEDDEDDGEEEDEGEQKDEEEEVDGEEEEEQGDGNGGIEDRFLKIKELEEYLENDEAREYGLTKEKQRADHDTSDDDDEEGEEDDDEEEDEDDEELGKFGDNADEDDEKFDNSRYEDFFVNKKKKNSRKRSRSLGGEDSGTDDEQEDDEGFKDQKKEAPSTHEKQLGKLRSKIEQMERANLEPKTWTMQGEITATKRPKNSALEVDLDFEHNVRPAPVITEEVTASLEDLIKKRILEGHFDDVQKVLSLPSKAPKELKEMDDNKSKKGLAEVYEEDYVQKTGLASATLSFSDERKKEASLLFKTLCLKLDALSHFHFTPKPVIEDMSVQANVPALAMEEIAPVAVSDAAMLAPEEVFAGKGDIKEEAELTKEERKRRRAKKKRRSKADKYKRMPKKALLSHPSGEGEE
ncbi:U3 small nucleolar ribonucleoprotein protein MPP10 [Macadamia integrifolia]|uniref:U3 small nucleolar ribonucleoprotein protein MPP10 n=1 Tax=Macadamia integrifolia TaxID=60698 RepID=UPI001C4F3A58|nr:U3 small nucleolar ribonucleoprotein protein MPP10 [Macadamia integrifolia]